ncbi:putative ABC transporter C family member 15 isoform X2 [Fagus crenata]
MANLEYEIMQTWSVGFHMPLGHFNPRKTGVIFSFPNGIADPLLNGKTDEHSKYKRESIYSKVLFQLVTFAWLNPLFAIGFKKPLEPEEIPDVDIKDSAEFLSRSFNESETS